MKRRQRLDTPGASLYDYFLAPRTVFIDGVDGLIPVVQRVLVADPGMPDRGDHTGKDARKILQKAHHLFGCRKVCSMRFEFLFVVLGVVLIVEGLPWFMSPRGTKRMLSELFSLNDHVLRSVGLVFMLLGLLFVYLAKA